MAAGTQVTLERSSDRVVVVHGLAANRAVTWLLGRRLRKQGFQTRLFGYPSLWQSVEAHARRLQKFVERVEAQDDSTPLHLVAHSMGGILVRVMLEHYSPPRLGRVVMLGTPNRGSHAARLLTRVIGKTCYPLAQLSDGPESPVHRFNVPAGIEIGVIAGSRDRVVALDATHLPGQDDHHVVRSGHGELLFRRDVAQQVGWFLRHGRFADASTASLDNPSANASDGLAKPA